MKIPIVDLPNKEAIKHEISTKIYYSIKPKSLAQRYWMEMLDYISSGIDEELAYEHIAEWINEMEDE